jgi:hypothetical protein
MQVWIRSIGTPEVIAVVRWRPLWGVLGERPLHVNKHSDGTWSYYGSGRAVADVLGAPIKVMVPARPLNGYVCRCWPAGTGEGELMALRKIVGQTGGGAAPVGTLADVATWPCLVEYLTMTSYPDGAARQVASLIVVADSSSWRGCVSDKDNDRTLWRSSATLEGLLLELEQALAADDPASWRQAGGGFKGKRKRS